jgi:hypothetical protein
VYGAKHSDHVQVYSIANPNHPRIATTYASLHNSVGLRMYVKESFSQERSSLFEKLRECFDVYIIKNAVDRAAHLDAALTFLSSVLDAYNGGEAAITKDRSRSTIARKGVLAALLQGEESAVGEIVESDMRVLEKEVVLDAELSGAHEKHLRRARVQREGIRNGDGKVIEHRCIDQTERIGSLYTIGQKFDQNGSTTSNVR